MSRKPASNCVRNRVSSSFVFSFALALNACGEQNGSPDNASSSDDQTSSGASGTSSQTMSNSAGQTGTTSAGTTSKPASSGGTGPSGSTSTGGTSTGPSGTSGGSGASTSASNGSSGASGSDTEDETSDTTEETSTGEDSDTTDTSGGETSDGPFECTREFLDGLLTDYLAALSAGDPSSLPLAASLKFTENAEEVEIGSTPFWMDAGDTKHVQAALDTTQCSVAAQAVVPEGTTDLPIGIRLKVEAGELTEVETIVVRQGDYMASFAVDSDPAKIISMAEGIGWHDEVPEADRATREELTEWVDTYFRAFPNGVCNVTDDCIRLENGGGPNFACGENCSGGDGSFEPRVILVDEVRGITTGFTIFDFQTQGHLDMHMAKMYSGEVHAVHAILRHTNGESGWD